jgi:hypothetical protein
VYQTDPELEILCDLQYRRLQYAEHCWILGILRPSNNLSPIHRVGLLLACSRKNANFIIGESSENKEEPGKNAGISCDGDVDGCGDFGRGKESVSDIFVRREEGHVIA